MKYTDYFTTSTRKDDKEFIKLKDDAPENLKDLIYDIHLNMEALPNDWIYSIIYEALESLQEDDLDDITIESDPYDHDLYVWFGEPFAKGYCDQALEEEIVIGKNIYDIISGGQHLAKREIYSQVNDFLQTYKEN